MVGSALKRSGVAVVVLMALVVVGAAAPSTSHVADQVTAYQSDPAHDGYIADAALTAPLAQAWSITLPGTVSNPLIVDGMVFVTAEDHRVYAFNQGTGSLIWSRAVGGGYAYSGLAYDGGRVFVVNSSGTLTAFDAATGGFAWSEQLPGASAVTAPPTAANGVVYASGENGALYAVREADGHFLWTQSVQGGDSSPAVTAEGVYASYGCGQAYDFDSLVGTALWHNAGSCIGGQGETPVVASGHVYVRDYAVGNVILSSSTGAMEGTFSQAQYDAGPAPAVANGVAFIVNGSTLRSVAGAGLGSTNWTFGGDGKLDTAPFVAGGLVFVGSANGNIYAVNAATGSQTWTTSTGLSVPYPSAPKLVFAAANGTLAVSADTKLLVYRPAGAIANAPSNQSPPSIDGSGDLNEIEAADVGIWSGLPDAYTYQWELCDGSGAKCADIVGATDPTYVPPVEDLGSTLRVRVVASNGIGSSAPIESAASAVLGLATAPPETSTAPVVTGTLTVGEQLSTTTGTWTNSATSFAYKWQRCDSSGSNCVDIAGATSAQYALVPDDAGGEIRSEVLASNAVGPATGGYAPSAPTHVVILVGTPAVPSLPADQATAYQVDPAHDGSIADAGLTAPLTQAWSITLPAFVGSSQQDGVVSHPLIVDGMVLVTDRGNGTVYALNQATGSMIWTQAVGATGGPAYDRGQIFVAVSGGLAALNAETGSVAWSEQLPGQFFFHAPPTAINGIVYMEGYESGGTLYAARESDGSLLWTQPIDSGESAPAVTEQGVYVSSGCQKAADFDPLSGSVLWQHTSPCFGGGGKTPVTADGHVFVRDTVLGNALLSSSTGATEGTFNPGPAPAVANGVAFMVERDASTLSAVAEDGFGNTNWTFTGDGTLDSAPLVAGSLVFVASAKGNVYALDAATGSQTWSASMGVSVSSDPSTIPPALAAANGTLAVSAGTKLVVYRPAGAITDAPSNVSPPSVAWSGDANEIAAADVGIWSELPTAYTYQWELCDGAGANCTDIAGATGSSYAPPTEDVGASLRVSVVATNNAGSSTPVESASSVTSPVVRLAQHAARQRLVSGTATVAVGQALSTTTGTWTNDPTNYAYKWQRCDDTGSHCSDIANATSTQYTLVAADSGHDIRSEVLASNAVGPASNGYEPSVPTSPVGGSATPGPLVAPFLSGTAAVGNQLSTTDGDWTNSPTGYAYRWQRCDSSGLNCVDIPNATTAHYTLVTADAGHDVRAGVRASNAAGPASGGYLPSGASNPVSATPELLTSPVVSGNATLGSQLSTTTGAWTYAPSSYQYKWQRCSNTGSSCVDIANANSAQYTPVAADVGHEIRSEVLASNTAGSAASGYAPSAPTGIVVRKPAVTTLPKVSGIAIVGHSLSVTNGTWSYSPTNYAYQWLRCTSTGTSCKKIAGATAPSYTLTSADVGHKLKAKVTASNAAGSMTATTSNASATVKK